MSKLVADSRPNATVAFPVTAPQVIAKLIEKLGGHVIWTKTDIRSLMSAAYENQAGPVFAADGEGGFIFTELHPTLDALFAFAKTLELLASQNVSLAQVRDSLPPYFVSSADVRCPWELKGKVMRVLTEELAEAKTELIDGIKIYHNETDWTLILPDSFESIIHIYSEGSSQDIANDLAHRYALKVTALRG
jgi:mannose-1-phosphate guanylyltransferase/phosphomannomutase